MRLLCRLAYRQPASPRNSAIAFDSRAPCHASGDEPSTSLINRPRGSRSAYAS